MVLKLLKAVLQDRYCVAPIATLAIALLFSTSASPHGLVNDQLRAVDSVLSKSPDDMEFLFKRADLHSKLGQYDDAVKDYNNIATLAPPSGELFFLRGRAYWKQGELALAMADLDRALSTSSNPAPSLLLMGDIEMRRGRPGVALQFYQRAIVADPAPKQGAFIKRARAQMKISEFEPEAIIAGLEEGIRHLGPLVTLLEELIDYLEKMKSYDAALANIERLPQALAHSPRWLVRRINILSAQGRANEAKVALQTLKSTLEDIPTHKRVSPSFASYQKYVDGATHLNQETGP